jgi:hypothetical protein
MPLYPSRYWVYRPTVWSTPSISQHRTVASNDCFMLLVVLGEHIPTAAPLDVPVKYNKATSPISSLFPSQFIFHLDPRQNLSTMAKISPTRFWLSKSYRGRTVCNVGSHVDHSQEASDNLSAASKSIKRQSYLQIGSRGEKTRGNRVLLIRTDRPILITDTMTIANWTSPPQGPCKKTYRIKKRDQQNRRPLQGVL